MSRGDGNASEVRQSTRSVAAKSNKGAAPSSTTNRAVSPQSKGSSGGFCTNLSSTVERGGLLQSAERSFRPSASLVPGARPSEGRVSSRP